MKLFIKGAFFISEFNEVRASNSLMGEKYSKLYFIYNGKEQYYTKDFANSDALAIIKKISDAIAHASKAKHTSIVFDSSKFYSHEEDGITC